MFAQIPTSCNGYMHLLFAKPNKRWVLSTCKGTENEEMQLSKVL